MNSGHSEAQMRISQEGHPNLHTLRVQGAQHIVGRSVWTTISGAGGGSWRSEVAGAERSEPLWLRARKLAVLLHHLWVSSEAYEPLHDRTLVKQKTKAKSCQEEKGKSPRPSSGECFNPVPGSANSQSVR
jgi:hypothetical protein